MKYVRNLFVLLMVTPYIYSADPELSRHLQRYYGHESLFFMPVGWGAVPWANPSQAEEEPDPDFETWFESVFQEPVEPAYWFEKVDGTTHRLRFRSKTGELRSYEAANGECWLLKFLFEDTVAGGLDRLRFHSHAQFGPGKRRAITMAVQGSREQCVQALLARGDGDDILSLLLRRAEELECTETTQQLIQERIDALGDTTREKDA